MRILGIDVGARGALALICTTACTLALADMPTEIATAGKSVTSPLGVAQAIQAAQPDAIFIEHVTSSPQAGVTSSFQFGRAYGVVLGVAAGTGAPLHPIRPQTWKSKLSVAADKRQAVTRATQLFPCASSSFFGTRGGLMDGRAEAAMVGLFGALNLGAAPQRALRLAEWPAQSELREEKLSVLRL